MPGFVVYPMRCVPELRRKRSRIGLPAIVESPEVGEAAVAALIDFIERLADFSITPRRFDTYRHMGATITDAILQAGLNYDYVVAPRVTTLMNTWPDAATTSNFLRRLELHGLADVLTWRDPVKPRRIEALTRFFHDNCIETEEFAQSWLMDPSNCKSVMSVEGVGPKTVDYMKGLVGISTIAVDRHIRTFVKAAGFHYTSYQEIHDLLSGAAQTLSVAASDLDRAIWKFVRRQQAPDDKMSRDLPQPRLR